MGKRYLRVTAGPSLDKLAPISVNTSKPHHIASELFEGDVATYIKDFQGEDGKVRDSEYFGREDRQGVTWSIQVRGRFLVPYNADDILFGNTFDRPLKLPWGTSAVLRFMNYMDPTLEHDLQSQSKPWALSPLISTMPYLAHHRARAEPSVQGDDTFPARSSLADDTSELHLASTSNDGSSRGSPAISDPGNSPSSGRTPASAVSTSTIGSAYSTAVEPPTSALVYGDMPVSTCPTHPAYGEMHFEAPAQRRSYFSSPENRRNVTFGPLDIIQTDFCYGFISFSPSLSLQLPGGLSFDLMRYWDGQPVRFVCCERVQGLRKNSELVEDGDGDEEEKLEDRNGDPWGRMFWCVCIEMVDGGDEGGDEDEYGGGEEEKDEEGVGRRDGEADGID